MQLNSSFDEIFNQGKKLYVSNLNLESFILESEVFLVLSYRCSSVLAWWIFCVVVR
jgi:hypothetical protein